MSRDKKSRRTLVLNTGGVEARTGLCWPKPCRGSSEGMDVARPKQAFGEIFCNHLLAARRLHFAWRAPWALLAKNESDFNFLETAVEEKILGGPHKADPENFSNRGQQTRASGVFVDMQDLWVKVRTWFVENWDKDEFMTIENCAGDSIGKMAKEDGD